MPGTAMLKRLVSTLMFGAIMGKWFLLVGLMHMSVASVSANESDLTECIGSGPTTQQLECIHKILDREDKRLNENYTHYKKHASRIDSKLEIRLRDVQRKWIAFRDKDCELARDMEGGGSLSAIEFAYCRALHTMRRAKDLELGGGPKKPLPGAS